MISGVCGGEKLVLETRCRVTLSLCWWKRGGVGEMVEKKGK